MRQLVARRYSCATTRCSIVNNLWILYGQNPFDPHASNQLALPQSTLAIIASPNFAMKTHKMSGRPPQNHPPPNGKVPVKYDLHEDQNFSLRGTSRGKVGTHNASLLTMPDPIMGGAPSQEKRVCNYDHVPIARMPPMRPTDRLKALCLERSRSAGRLRKPRPRDPRGRR